MAGYLSFAMPSANRSVTAGWEHHNGYTCGGRQPFSLT